MFPKINNYRNAMYYLRGLLDEGQAIEYTGTVKLHGCHATVVVHPNGLIDLYSRNVKLTGGNDKQLNGFVGAMRKKEWSGLARSRVVAYHGEWIGRGINAGSACQLLHEKEFVVYDAMYDEDRSYVDMDAINALEDIGIKNVFGVTYKAMVCPYSPLPDIVDKYTEDVGSECPFMLRSFSLSGNGEGIVWTPTHPNYRCDTRLWFKTKASNFTGRSVKLPKDVINTNAFLPEWRLRQFQYKFPQDPKYVKDFVEAIRNDIKEEEGLFITKKELRACAKKAAEFFLSELR